MKALDGWNLATMGSSFMQDTGTEIAAGLNTITVGTRTTTVTRIATATTTTARTTLPEMSFCKLSVI